MSGPNKELFYNYNCKNLKKELEKILQKVKLNAIDEKYVREMELEYRKKLLVGISNYNLENSSEDSPKKKTYISVLNRLRLIEAFFDDAAKEHIRQTQEILNRAQLDARNLIHKIIDYFQVVCDLCNDENFVAYIQAIPQLHDEFRIARTIKKTGIILLVIK